MDAGTYANIAFAGVAIFGAIIAGIALSAYRRTPSPRMGLVAGGFVLMTLQGVVVGVGLFAGGWDPFVLLFLTAAFEAALLLVLFLATLMR